MHMMPIIDIEFVDDGGCNTGEAVGAAHMIEKGPLELLGETVDDSIRVLAKDLHLALMGFAHAVAFETFSSRHCF